MIHIRAYRYIPHPEPIAGLPPRRGHPDYEHVFDHQINHDMTERLTFGEYILEITGTSPPPEPAPPADLSDFTDLDLLTELKDRAEARESEAEGLLI